MGGERGEDSDDFAVDCFPVGGGEVDFERGAGDKTDPSAKSFRQLSGVAVDAV